MLSELPKRPTHHDFENREFTLEEARFLGQKESFITIGFKDCPIGDAHVAELRNLKRLVRIFLEGTAITDAALESLAALPSLEFLVLDRTSITGEGFRHFQGHPSLKTLWAAQTSVNDQTVPLVVAIPKLSILRIPQTKVSVAGLRSLAAHPILKVVGDQFTQAQMEEFQATQRRLAREAKGVAAPNADDMAEATRVLTSFFEAMNVWETSLRVDTSGSTQAPVDHDQKMATATETCRAIFAQYCTPKDRVYGRPNALSWSWPPEHQDEVIVDAEQPSRQKILIYTKNAQGGQSRYTMKRTRGEWRVDHKESLLQGWSRDSL